MSLLETLATGARGVRLKLPQRLCQVASHPNYTELHDPDDNVQWFLFLADGIHLSTQHGDVTELRAAMEAHARCMFEEAHAMTGARSNPRTTTDANWSPMIDAKLVHVKSSNHVSQDDNAWMTVHRMSYEPGAEVILGHLLVPTRRGLFEGRVMAIDRMTGFRETALMMQRLQPKGRAWQLPTGGLPPMSQSEMDDPRHDAAFPKHALSRVRRALDQLWHEWSLQVTEPPSNTHCASRCDDNQVQLLQGLGCALEPPPRFVLVSEAQTPNEPSLFSRTSFCVTDGVESFEVVREDSNLEQAASLADRITAQTLEVALLTSLSSEEVVVCRTHDSADAVVVIAEGRRRQSSNQGSVLHAFIWFTDERGHPWSFRIKASGAINKTVRTSELLAARESFRLLERVEPA